MGGLLVLPLSYFTLLIYILGTEIKQSNKPIPVSQKHGLDQKQDNPASQRDTLVFISWEK